MIFFADIERDRERLSLSRVALCAASGVDMRTYARLMVMPFGGKDHVLQRLAETINELRQRLRDDRDEVAQLQAKLKMVRARRIDAAGELIARRRNQMSASA